MSHFVVYILSFHEIIVYKISPGGGEGVYCQPKVYKQTNNVNNLYHLIEILRISLIETKTESGEESKGDINISYLLI